MPSLSQKDLSPEWQRLMAIAERIQFGECRLVFQRGKPVRVEAVIQQIKLDGPDSDIDEKLKIITLG